MKRAIQSFIPVIFVLALSLGCATNGRTGALTGAGLGALAVQAIGDDTERTLLGTGAGAGIGYIIGNEKDKRHARALERDSDDFTHTETAPLGGTRWRLIRITPDPGDYRSKVVTFKESGVVTTTTTFSDGAVDVVNERYRVSGDTVIINNDDYLLNAGYEVEGDELVLRAENWRAVFQRI